MAAKFSRFHENRSYQTGNAGLAHFEDDEPTVEKATLDEHIAEENIGYQMALRLGWETGTGLGRKKQGRTEPIPLVMKEDFLCIGRLALEFAQADEATSQRRALEIEKEETDELQQKYQNELEKEKTIEESLRDLKEMFYCEMCDKQYFKYKEYDNHINSYDHAHRQRLRELRQRESTRNIYAKKKKEQKQMEKEMQRLHLLSGKSAESQSSAGFQVAFKGSAGKSSASSGFKPITVQKGFTAVPPPPAESPPPLPSEPAPPLPSEPPPPLPPSDDQPVKKPFSFKLGGGQGDAAEKTTSTKPGLSFSLGKKQAPGVQLFGVKSKPIKSTASAFMESDSEEEEEEDSPEENSGVYEGEDLPSTPMQQQDTLEKVIEYADTLKLKEALRPRLLIRFVKGTAMNGVLPGTLSTPEGDKIKKKACDGKRDSKEERRESKHKSKKSRHKNKEPSERQFKESKDIREESSDRLFKESKVIRKETSDRQFKESKDIRKETCDSTESRDHKESQEERKSSSRKKESHEGKRGFHKRWDDSSRTKTIKE